MGTELLIGVGVDTNTTLIGSRLLDLGVDVELGMSVSDVRERIADAVSYAAAMRGVDIVLISGGLGPTFDDVTREGVAGALGLGVERAAEHEERIRERYAQLGREATEVALRQADRIGSAELLTSGRGTAPGQILTHKGKVYVLLPGVPGELAEMLDQAVVPWLASRFGLQKGRALRRLRTTGTVESEVEAKTAGTREAHPELGFTILAYPEEVDLVIWPRDASGRRAVEQVTAELEEGLGDLVFGRNQQTLEATVVGLLGAAELTVATAESCTGGLVAKRLTDVPGASAVFLGGVVAYSNEAKQDWLSVGGDLLEHYGAVSSPVAAEMAGNVRLSRRTTYGLSVTGVAGPGGGTKEKPVGLTYLALADGSGVQTIRRVLSGDRDGIRRRASQIALDMLRRAVSDHIAGRRTA